MSTLKTINVIHPSGTVNNIVNDANGNVAVGGTLTVGGVAAVAVAPSTSGNVLTSNGTAWTSAAPSGGTAPSAIGQIPFSTNGSTYTPTQKIVQGTAVASTSGTSIDFTGIPSWVKRVTVMFNGVSTNGASQVRLRIGPSGGVETSGYLGTSETALATGQNTQNFTAGFDLYDGGSASAVRNGTITFSLLNSSTNTWCVSASIGQSNEARMILLGGVKSLAGALSIVSITTVNGTDTFDAGSINIMYE